MFTRYVRDKIGTQIILFPSLIPVTVGQTGVSCPGSPETTTAGIVAVIVHLQNLAVRIAIPAAGLAYAIAGLYWMRGSLKSQETARRIFINSTIGLVIILLSDSLVKIVLIPLCEAGGM